MIRSRDLGGVGEEEICKNLTSQGVVVVKRINICWNYDLLPIDTLILTFTSPTLPNSVKAGYLNIPVVPYIPNPEILRDIPNSITPQTTLHLLPILVGLLILPCTRQCRWSHLTPSPIFFSCPRHRNPRSQYLCP